MNHAIPLAGAAVFLLLTGCADMGMTNHHCRDKTVNAIFTDSEAETSLRIVPGRVRICEGKDILVKLPQSMGSGKIAETRENTGPKSAPWLNKTISSGDTIKIEVPEGAASPDDYKYDLIIGGVGSIDPRVRVNDN